MYKQEKKNKDFTIDESMKFVQEIMQNYSEDYGFVNILDRFKNKEFQNERSIVVGKTPNVLVLGGANKDLNLIINPRTILKCMSKPTKRYHGHDLDRDIFKYLIHELRNPVVLLKGSKENTLVAVTDLRDRENRPVIVTIALNRFCQHHLANQITSVYGREHFDNYIERQFKEGNVIAINKNKANHVFQSASHNWPIEETTISFDDSIAYSFKNVNGISDKNSNFFLENEIKDTQSAFSADIDNVFKVLYEHTETFKAILTENEKIIEMIKFFEYAGQDIYDSLLWHQFQQDKEYLNENEYVSKLQEIVSNAQKSVESIERECNSKEYIENKQELLLS